MSISSLATVDLLTPMQLGRLHLPNRVVMAPLTRNRAGAGNVPSALQAIHYAQRASAGLLISEATQVSADGQGYPSTPGIHSPEQVEGWKQVTQAVHAAGGRIFLQLWHVGRVSHSSYLPNGTVPIAPSAIAPAGEVFTLEGMKPYETPRALDLGEIPAVVERYRQGAEYALAAGFDGVEIHAANGYLLDQFLRDGTNQRTDQYGGSLANRVRLIVEVVEAILPIWGADRTGIRISPGGTFNSMTDSNTLETFTYLVKTLDPYHLAYLHIREADESDLRHGGELIPAKVFRPLFRGAIIVNGGYDKARGNQVLAAGEADLVAYGRPYIANPDLVERFRLNVPLNGWDESTFYGGTEVGYTDYPVWNGGDQA
ncbi:MAG: alkene reductase [Synechococcales cyanobacterium]